MTNGDYLRRAADQKGIPLRTLADVKSALAQAKASDADASMARLMLRHGRLTAPARAYLNREYKQA